MNRVKLPGRKKFKIGLLIILALVAIGIIIKVGIDNRKDVKVEDQISSEENIYSEEENADRTKAKTDGTEEQPLVNQEEESLYNEAYNLFFQGNYGGAIEKANIIIAKFTESYKAYNIRGIAKAYSIGFDEGMKDIDKALEIKSDYGYARFNKALNYELYGKYNEAMVWYDKALEVESYMWSYYGKASIYGRRGDIENTVLNLKKAIEVEGVISQESGIKKEARTEKDFDPVRGNNSFEDLIK